MNYNTTRDALILPEYGRNVQRMIKYAIGIEKRDERNKAANAIIELMGQLNPHLRDVEDFRHKLWTHLFLMSDFKLDVDSPYEIPKIENLQEKPKKVNYPSSKFKYGHYGKYTSKILKESANIKKEEENEFLTRSMANFMKKQYLMHNNDAVENNLIAENLHELSDGNLTLENPDSLTPTSSLLKTLGINNNTNHKRNNKGHHKKRKYKRN